MGEASNDLALIGIARDDRRDPFVFFECVVAQVKPEASFSGAGIGPVALVAVFGEDGANVPIEFEFRGGGCGKRAEGQDNRRSRRHGSG